MLFAALQVPAIVPFGITALALIVYVAGIFRSGNGLKKASLLLSFFATVIFSVLAWKLQPACNCSAFSFVDLVPNLVLLAMMTLIWIAHKPVAMK